MTILKINSLFNRHLINIYTTYKITMRLVLLMKFTASWKIDSYIYIYIERERERENRKKGKKET
jgi:hypothetical protein